MHVAWGEYDGRSVPFNMHRSLEFGICLRAGIRDERIIAQAFGNLAASRLQRERNEKLEWHVLGADTSLSRRHFRLVIRHPQRVLDRGRQRNLSELHEQLSDGTPDELARLLSESEARGPRQIPVGTIHEAVDFWQEDLWKWLGGPSRLEVGLPPRRCH